MRSDTYCLQLKNQHSFLPLVEVVMGVPLDVVVVKDLVHRQMIKIDSIVVSPKILRTSVGIYMEAHMTYPYVSFSEMGLVVVEKVIDLETANPMLIL